MARAKRADLLGKKFERLTIIKKTKIKRPSGNSRTAWMCQCDCGNEVTVDTYSLTSGNTKSCGCYKIHVLKSKTPWHRQTFGESAKHKVIAGYKARALKKRLEFQLTEEECLQLFSQQCYYCNSGLTNRVSGPHHYGEFLYNGIDRVDSKKGYVAGNVVTCCRNCNQAKSDKSIDEFEEWAIRLAEQIKIKRSYEITETMAIKLEKVLGISADFWINREKAYRDYIKMLESRLDELG